MTQSRPRHVGSRANDHRGPVTDWAGAPSVERPASNLPAGVNVDALLASPAVSSGEVTAAVTITVRGEIDTAALERIRELLDQLVGTSSMVVADLYRARCRTGRLLAELTKFRDRRHRLELETRLEGLHPGVIPDLETADLTEVFGAYRDARRSPYSE